MSKQLTLFGTCARSTKNYIIYRNPKGDYECFIERYCLRARRERGHIANQKIVAEPQSKWKNIYKGNHAKLEEFFVLQENEKEFARYSSITYIIKHYMFICQALLHPVADQPKYRVCIIYKTICNFIIFEKKLLILLCKNYL